LEDVLAERGWIQPADRPHVAYLVERQLQKHADDARAALTHLPLVAREGLEALEGLDTEKTIPGPRPAAGNRDVDGPSAAPAAGAGYAFTSLHATGGIGRVWRARDRQLDREVALKELRPERAGDGKTAARFVREARLTGQLEHPGIVPVYE